ncbi:MAG: L-aspartate oxidase [Terriglobia bacterium]
MIDAIMGAAREHRADYLVAGGGIAGLRAAIELAAGGKVLVLTKNGASVRISCSPGASHASFTGSEDELTVHQQETIRSGGGLCCEDAVRVLTEGGPGEIKRLIAWGARFESAKRGTGEPAGVARGPRVMRSEAGWAVSEILRTLLAKAKSLSSLQVKPFAMVAELLIEDGRVSGACYLDEQSRSIKTVRANAVILATGGLGQVYAHTTHPPSSCGDGIAMAYRAGALLRDLEFVQFHPTVLSTSREPCLALSAALRERGAILRNLELERFMPRYHEDGELAPADVLARAIASEMQRGRSNFVYMDLAGINPEHVKRDFPRLYAACLENNIDLTSDLIPTHPAAHFGLGGIAVDVNGSTNLEGLYAAGEAAATGAHGANSFGANSVIESLVFGAQAARAALGGAPAARFPAPTFTRPAALADAAPVASATIRDPAHAMRDIHRIMWEAVGLMREGLKLKEASNCLDRLTLAPADPPDRPHLQIQNALEAARLITRCAEARKESRGAHYRTDYPLPNSSEPARHSYVSRSSGVYFR